MAATLIFEVYGPSKVPIMSNFTPATHKTPRQNYVWFAVAMLQNGRYQLSWLSVGPKDLVMLKNNAHDVKKTPSDYYFRFGIRHLGKWPPVFYLRSMAHRESQSNRISRRRRSKRKR
jgi:hypothetical protein